MSGERLTYDALQQAMRKQFAGYALTRGQGGPLVFCWAAGLAVFILLLDAPLVAAVWTVASAAIGAAIVRGYDKNRPVHEVLLRSILEKRYPVSDLSDPNLRTSLHKATGLGAEIALKIGDIERAHGIEPDLRRVLSDVDGMLSLQFESARQAEEFERVLRLIDAAASTPRPFDGVQEKRSGRPSGSVKLHQENLAAIQKEAAEARAMVEEVFRQLEILLLQVVQMEKRAIDIVQTREFARQTEASLERMQERVSARRDVADSVLEDLMPDVAVRSQTA